jgi:hypothetical protein
MPKVTAAICVAPDQTSLELIASLADSGFVADLVLSGDRSQEVERLARAKARWIEGSMSSGSGILRLLELQHGDYLLIAKPGEQVRLGPNTIQRFLSVAEDSAAGLIYSDFRDEDGNSADHPLIDYQPGSIRDSFEFGNLILLSKKSSDLARDRYGNVDPTLRWGGLYDLRLKVSINSQVLRIPEPLYTRVPIDRRASGEKQFDYVDPRHRDYQVEMESIATTHLRRIGAHIDPNSLKQRASGEAHSQDEFNLKASVIIPVRNRERTIKEAVNSALRQKASFTFNVIVVDNHSTDRTTELLQEMSGVDPRVVHLTPSRTDLGIGGCWNQAIFSDHCGEFAVQLDSDDLYADDQALARIVAKFEEGGYPMVIGSYTIVNFDLAEIPPGLIDHREWTRENGHNNALRINGLGAPRAFWVPLLRRFGGLPNTSYGEDYATALRISREYEIGRIYESIYYARRWEGNSDASLPLATANRYDWYKDYLRTVEISARRRLIERRKQTNQ